MRDRETAQNLHKAVVRLVPVLAAGAVLTLLVLEALRRPSVEDRRPPENSAPDAGSAASSPRPRAGESNDTQAATLPERHGRAEFEKWRSIVDEARTKSPVNRAKDLLALNRRLFDDDSLFSQYMEYLAWVRDRDSQLYAFSLLGVGYLNRAQVVQLLSDELASAPEEEVRVHAAYALGMSKITRVESTTAFSDLGFDMKGLKLSLQTPFERYVQMNPLFDAETRQELAYRLAETLSFGIFDDAPRRALLEHVIGGLSEDVPTEDTRAAIEALSGSLEHGEVREVFHQAIEGFKGYPPETQRSLLFMLRKGLQDEATADLLLPDVYAILQQGGPESLEDLAGMLAEAEIDESERAGLLYHIYSTSSEGSAVRFQALYGMVNVVNDESGGVMAELLYGGSGSTEEVMAALMGIKVTSANWEKMEPHVRALVADRKQPMMVRAYAARKLTYRGESEDPLVKNFMSQEYLPAIRQAIQSEEFSSSPLDERWKDVVRQAAAEAESAYPRKP